MYFNQYKRAEIDKEKHNLELHPEAEAILKSDGAQGFVETYGTHIVTGHQKVVTAMIIFQYKTVEAGLAIA